MAAVDPPSRTSAIVNFTPRPWRRSMAMNITEPSGRATKASAKTPKESSVPVTRSTCGNTSTEAIA